MFPQRYGLKKQGGEWEEATGWRMKSRPSGLHMHNLTKQLRVTSLFRRALRVSLKHDDAKKDPRIINASPNKKILGSRNLN